MKKAIQGLVSIMLAMVLLAACGGGASSSTAPASGASGAASASAPAGTDEKIVIGMAHRNLLGVTGADIRAAAYWKADQEGVELKFFDANGDVEAQANFIEDCLAGGEVKAIMLWTADADGIAQTVRECNEQGVPVVSVDISIPDAEVVNHVASDNVEVGRLAGQQAVDYLVEKNGSEKGTIVVCTATSMDSLRYRTQGFHEIVDQYPDIEIKEHEMVTTTIDDGVALADDLMQLYPVGSIDVIFGASVSPTLGAVTAAQTYNRDDFVVVGVDNDPNLTEELQKGAGNTVLLGFVAQDPYNIGETGMGQAIKAARGEDTGEVRIGTKVTMVTADNIQQFLDDYAAYSAKVEKFR